MEILPSYFYRTTNFKNNRAFHILCIISIHIIASFLIYTIVARHFQNLQFIPKSSIPTEIHEILSSTPYFWRRFDLPKNFNILGRIIDQQEWIKRLSKTKYITKAKVNHKISSVFYTEKKINRTR